ncbi:hypothetical protein SISNIDRAFT_458617 [Sistotremastrum niveocremeum HHB9708]|uniref:MYND-type domain-containing protein n=1 Tax=Sistotremastrum niveocremeum HHB9708 TaxID=1314777 RepID=A0A164QHS6_9AGAM|nr:hypothetical protein SISNIDRAFT_458617 [Sistotremastrum niveocremeum HHB9708]
MNGADPNVAANFGFNGAFPPNFDMNQAMAAMAAAMGMDPNAPIDQNVLENLLGDVGMDQDLLMDDDMDIEAIFNGLDLAAGVDLENPNNPLGNINIPWMEEHEAANTEAQKLGQPSDSIGKPIEEIVGERLKLLRRGHELQVFDIGNTGLSTHGFVAPAEPPVQGGIMDCLESMRRIVIEDYDEGAENETGFQQIPSLLTRVRDLLRIFYDFKVGHLRTPDLSHCDFPELFDVAYGLHEIGLTIQLDPSRLKALMDAAGPEIERVILDEGLGIGRFRELAKQYEAEKSESEQHRTSAFWSHTDGRGNSQMIKDRADRDLAAYASVYFYADIMIALLLDRSGNSGDHRTWRSKAMKKIVHWSSDEEFRHLFGDCLSDAMRPIYWDQQLLVEFCGEGGLASLIKDATQGGACSVVAEEAFTSLPDTVWKSLTESGLSMATETLLSITGWAYNIQNFRVLLNASHKIYTTFGTAPFNRLSMTKKWNESLMFHRLVEKLREEEEAGLPKKTQPEWKDLLLSAEKALRGIDHPLRWSRLSPFDRWRCLELYGCENPDCIHTIKFLRLREMRARGLREGGEAEMDKSLYEWGKGLRGCEKCQSRIYCSTECQNDDWKEHERLCRRYQQAREGGNLNVGPGGIPVFGLPLQVV